ncbi:MAG: signal peptidase II [Candidatus Tectomicrobia bacterium]|uniref:Lipoprotein signal peptidase n=1 Tax=Tectimicrobiota bacterium TaxID=2528274 RepID=A0A933LQ38_UNCTE|nr:signal peptidase II [Candidatus Tectomicrobia bacterium]
MKAKLQKRHLFYGLMVVLILFFDQLSKSIVQEKFQLYQSVEVIAGFFNITYLRNPGAAFGIFSHANPQIVKPVFFVIAIVALAVMMVIYFRAPEKDRLTRPAMCLIFSGAMGNIIDRWRLGEVVDFLDFYLYSYHWPAFNLADTSITIGVGLFILSLLRRG